MSSGNSPKFDECTKCKFYNRKREMVQCKHCGGGEFFEIKTRFLQDDDDFLDFFQRNYRSIGDE